jgi:predicted DNA-binding protein
MPDIKLLQLKIKIELWERLLKASQADNRTISGYVRNLINKALEEVKRADN